MNTVPYVPHRSRGPKIALIILGILAVLVLVPVLALVIWRQSLSAKVDVRLKAIRTAGYPVSTAELETWYAQVPDDENAALLWEEGAGQIDGVGNGASAKFQAALRKVPRTLPLAPDLKQQLAQLVAQNNEAFVVFERAAKLKKSRYSVDLSQGFSAQLPHLQKIKAAANLLYEKAFLEVENRNSAAAVAALEQNFAVGRSLAEEPLIISYLVRVAANAIACSSVERAVNRVQLSDAALVRLTADLNAGDDTNSVVRALAGERAAAIPLFRMNKDQLANVLAQGTPDQLPINLQGASALNRLTGFFDRDLVFYLDTMQRFLDATHLPASQRFAEVNQFDRNAEEARRRLYIISAMTLPALGKVQVRDADNSARLRSAATALAVERYRLKHNGQLPASLQALVPDVLPSVPLDPFDGEPLRYRKLGKGYVVYSIGSDHADDGGTERTNEKGGGKSAPFDITFTVER